MNENSKPYINSEHYVPNDPRQRTSEDLRLGPCYTYAIYTYWDADKNEPVKWVTPYASIIDVPYGNYILR